VLRDPVRLLIIGAGPYGLSMAAQCGHLGIDHLLLGRPMEFWRSSMPRGMRLRSRTDWHLDPLGIHTLDAYLRTLGLTPEEADPIPLETYLAYAAWFQQRSGIHADRRLVRRLEAVGGAGHPFRATLEDGRVVAAANVLVTTGFGACAHVPDELARILPEGSYRHTRDCADLRSLAGRSCLIVGGRQSAFEWAALAVQNGAAEVHLCYRHDTPGFARADWTWVDPMLEELARNPRWYRDLTEEARDEITRHMWRIGRQQLEAWLAPAIAGEAVHLWPRSNVVACRRTPAGRLEVGLDRGHSLIVDELVLATGYRMDVGRLQFLAGGDLLPRLATRNGYPVLDEHFQSTVPGLHFTNRFAAQDFGHFFDFTAGVRAAAAILGRALVASAESAAALPGGHRHSRANTAD